MVMRVSGGMHVFHLSYDFFFATPICVPCTLSPNCRLVFVSCQCACRGERCNIMSVLLDLPLVDVPPSEDCNRYVN